MKYFAIFCAFVVLFPSGLFGQQSARCQKIIRTINHSLATLTQDNEFEKDIVYEVGMLDFGKVYLDKSWTNYKGERQLQHFELQLRELNGFRQHVYNAVNRSLTLLCTESSVISPWINHQIIEDELELSCLNGTKDEMRMIIDMFLRLRDEVDVYYLAQLFPSAY